MPRKNNFTRCAVKKIEIVEYYRPRSHEGNIWTKGEPKNTKGYELMMGAELFCPRSKGTVATDLTDSTLEAVQDLEELALAAVCSSCPFSRLPREKVDRIVAAELEAEALRIRAETELEKANQEYRRVIALGMEALEGASGQDTEPKPET